MKLRIKGDSLRFRITPSEMRKFLDTGRVEDTVHFGPTADAKLTYALEHHPAAQLDLRYSNSEVAILIPSTQASAWASSDEVGIYSTISVGEHSIEISVEKDWACLDGNDIDNSDTFPNPLQGTTC